MHPELYSLVRIRWQYFGSLTFKQVHLSGKVRQGMFLTYIRKLANKFGVHFNRVLWVSRLESGSKFGRLHYHYLIGGLSPNSVNVSQCFRQAATWESIGGGMARVYVFDQTLNGLDYIAKNLDAGLVHETGKFGVDTASLTLSQSTLCFIKGCLARDRRDVQHNETMRVLPWRSAETSPV